MSGNNFDDILEKLNEKEKISVKKLIEFMEKYHPKIEIDRNFQRNLKNTLLSKVKKSRSGWYFHLSYLSVIATCFIVIFSGIIKLHWFGLGANSNTASKLREIPVAKLENMNDFFVSDSGLTLGYTTKNSPEINKDSNLGEKPVEHIQNATQKTPMTMKTSEVSGVTSTQGEDLHMADLSNEIQDITNTIDAIAGTQMPAPNPPADLGMSRMAKGIEATSFSLVQTNEAQISLNYPSRIAIYKKSTAWSRNEQESRSGSGSEKFLVNTRTKSEVGLLISNIAPSTESLLYKTAKKEGDTEYYLIPCLEYKDIDGITFVISLVDGYSLD